MRGGLELFGAVVGRAGARSARHGRRGLECRGPRCVVGGQQSIQRLPPRSRPGQRCRHLARHSPRWPAITPRPWLSHTAHRTGTPRGEPDQVGDQGGRGVKPAPAETEDREERQGAVFWVALVVGWLIIGYGLRGLLQHHRDTRPANLARFFVGGALLHDLVFAPAVLIAGVLIARAVPARVRSVVQVGLIVSGCLALFSYPLVRGFGHAANNPSSLPHNYIANLMIVLGVVWFVLSVVAAVKLVRHGNSRGYTDTR